MIYTMSEAGGARRSIVGVVLLEILVEGPSCSRFPGKNRFFPLKKSLISDGMTTKLRVCGYETSYLNNKCTG